MVIRADTEIRHDVLGPIRYDDGQPHEHFIGDSKVYAPMWVARPGGWEGDLEFYLACGDDNAPGEYSLQKAVALFANYEQIEAAARGMVKEELAIAWFDCTTSVTTMALTDARDSYILWTAILDADGKILEITEGSS